MLQTESFTQILHKQKQIFVKKKKKKKSQNIVIITEYIHDTLTSQYFKHWYLKVLFYIRKYIFA